MLLPSHINLTALICLALFLETCHGTYIWRNVTLGFSKLCGKPSQPASGTKPNIEIPKQPIPEEIHTTPKSDAIPIRGSPNMNISRKDHEELPELPRKNHSSNNLYDSGNYMDPATMHVPLTSSQLSGKDEEDGNSASNALQNSASTALQNGKKFSKRVFQIGSLRLNGLNGMIGRSPTINKSGVFKRASDESPPGNSNSSLRTSRPTGNKGKNPQEEFHAPSPSSNHLINLKLSKKSAGSQVPVTEGQTASPLPNIKEIKRLLEKNSNISEDSNPEIISDSDLFFFSRISIPIKPEEQQNLEARFGKFSVSEERLLSNRAVLEIERRMATSALLEEKYVQEHNMIIEDYVNTSKLPSRSNDDLLKETILTERALDKIPVNSQDLMVLFANKISPTYGLIYLRVRPQFAISLNIYLIEAVSPLICTENQQYISVITKAGIILTFKRVSWHDNIFPVPTWQLIEHPDRLFIHESHSIPNFKSVLIDSVLAELCLIVNPFFIIVQNTKEIEKTVLSLLYPYRVPQKPICDLVINKYRILDDSLLEPTIHLNLENCIEDRWWIAQTQGDVLFDNEKVLKFLNLLPNGSPWFEISGIGRGDLFKRVLADFNAFVLENNDFYDNSLIPEDYKKSPEFYHPRMELLSIKVEMLKRWRICQYTYQSPSCQVARALASVYIFRLLKICQFPIKGLYINERSQKEFVEKRDHVVNQIDYLRSLNNIDCDWLCESFQKCFYVYTKLALTENLKFHRVKNTKSTKKIRSKVDFGSDDAYTVSRPEEPLSGELPSQSSVDNSRAVDSGVDDSDYDGLNLSDLVAAACDTCVVPSRASSILFWAFAMFKINFQFYLILVNLSMRGKSNFRIYFRLSFESSS
jgi:hypothetical protein